MGQGLILNHCGSGGIDLTKTSFLSASGGGSCSVNINKKVMAISCGGNVWETGAGTLKIVVNGSTITCSESNGTFTHLRSESNSAGKRTVCLVWVNNGPYKDKVITSASYSGPRTDGDDVIIVTTID